MKSDDISSLFVALLVAPFSLATPVHIRPRSTPWSKVQCTESSLANAAANPSTRWAAADASNAFQAAVVSWNHGAVAPGNVALTFSESVSNFFHGPEQWNCKDIGNQPCSGVVQCDSTNHPAGWLILNSFSSLHQIHQHRRTALQDALSDMTPNLGTFASTFAPQLSNENELIGNLLTFFSAIIGVGSAFSWNVVIKEAKIFADDNYRGFYKDVFNSAVSLAVTAAKQNLPAAQSALGTQNTISSALSSLLDSWQKVESDTLAALFSGDDDSVSRLNNFLQSGMMASVPNSLDLSTMTAEAQKILYGKLIPIAWNLAPGNLHPFILMTTDPCSSTAQGSVKGFMTDDTAAQTHVCYGGYTFYVLNANHVPRTCNAKDCIDAAYGDSAMQFQKLPGGTFGTLSGGKFGDVSLSDIVISSYQGWQLAGNSNGYQMPELSRYIDGTGTEGDFIFQNGIQSPGFFNLPICNNVAQTIRTISSTSPGGSYWPCGPPRSTNIHVNTGCISINGSPRCHPNTYNVAYQNSPTSTVTIYAQFNGNDKSDKTVTPGCKLNAEFPSNYGDVYFGADNCLYDGSGNRIDNQCCTASTTDQVQNPYKKGK